MSFQRKHQIYKHGRHWYAICGVCVRPLWSPSWPVSVELLKFHVTEGHEDEVLTREPAVAHT